MTTQAFVLAIWNYLLADPSHLVVLGSVLAAVTPTPDPNTTAGKFYKLIDILAVNFLQAKDTGVHQVPVNDIAKLVCDAVVAMDKPVVAGTNNTAVPQSTTQASGLAGS